MQFDPDQRKSNMFTKLNFLHEFFLDHIKDTNCNLSASIIILIRHFTDYIFQSDNGLVLSRKSYFVIILIIFFNQISALFCLEVRI